MSIRGRSLAPRRSARRATSEAVEAAAKAPVTVSADARPAIRLGPGGGEPRPRRRRVLAFVLSFVLVLVAILVMIVGLSIAIEAAIEAAGRTAALDWVHAGLELVAGLGIVFGGWLFMTRVRPGVVRRLCRCEVPRIPAPLRWMATADGDSGWY